MIKYRQRPPFPLRWLYDRFVMCFPHHSFSGKRNRGAGLISSVLSPSGSVHFRRAFPFDVPTSEVRKMDLLITHYYHSGFSIEMDDLLFVFDYWRGEHHELQGSAQILPEKLKYQDCFCMT